METYKKIFITGGTGFVGKNLLKVLSKDSSCKISVLTRNIPSEKYQNVRFLIGDLRKGGQWESEIHNTDVIFHLASLMKINESLGAPREIIEKNTAMTLSLLEAVRKSGNKPFVIFTSTDRLYGKTKKITVTENEPTIPIEPYTASKLISEKIIETYNQLYDIPYIIFRPDSIFGPHQPKTMFISDIIQKMIFSDSVEVGNLGVEKNFIFVEDLIDGLIKAAHAPSSAQNTIYNIGGSHTNLKKILILAKKIIEEKTGKKIKIIANEKLSRPTKIEVNPFKLDITKARNMLKWAPKTPLKNGLEKTIDYFLSQYNEK